MSNSIKPASAGKIKIIKFDDLFGSTIEQNVCYAVCRLGRKGTDGVHEEHSNKSDQYPLLSDNHTV